MRRFPPLALRERSSIASGVPADGSGVCRPLVVSIVGTRPEAIKMAPVVRAIATRGSLDQELILTGQHENLDDSFDLPPRAIRKLRLDLREQTAGEIREVIEHALCGQLVRRRPDLVLVQGDTSTALAGALAAHDCSIPLGHVEAGLRSGDVQQPWPEELNRIRIDALAALLFAPTQLAAAKLAEEKVTGTVHVTGNSGIDALLAARLPCPSAAAIGDRKQVLATCHRRENWGELSRVAEALKGLVRELPLQVTFLLHTSPHLRQSFGELLADEPHVTLVSAVDHREMVRLMDSSWLILTDSGGIQEEGPALGRPVFVLRNVTERGEAITSDSIELVGTDPERIVTAVRRLLDQPELYARMSRPSFPFGDGRAGPRIAALVEEYLFRGPGSRAIASRHEGDHLSQSEMRHLAQDA